MNPSSWVWPVIVIMSAVGTGTLVFGNVLPAVRHLLSFWFLLVCPGMAYVSLLPVRDSLARWMLAIALSVAIDTVVATFMLYTGNWSPNGGLVALIAISIGGAALQLKDMRLAKGASSMHQVEDGTNRQLAQAISLVGATLSYAKVMTDKAREKFQRQNGSLKDSGQADVRLEVTEDATRQQGQSEDSSHLAGENVLLRELVETQRGRLQVLREELEAKRRDIQELHVLLQHSQGQRT